MERRFVEKIIRRRPRTVEVETAAPLIPPRPTIANLQEAARDCRACPLWKTGTQTVFGEGSRHARVVFVGEQPGNDEDLAGKPFVGPAGKLLDKALAEAGINRGEVYVTNAVKHFKWEPQGKRRIHKKPNAREIVACRPWLEAELAVLKPDILVCLGATAAQDLLGKEFRVSRQRGQFIESELASFVMATVHPSSILRAPDDETRRGELKMFVADLRKVTEKIHNLEIAEWKHIDSTAVTRVRYHAKEKLLDVQYVSDGAYRYGAVEAREYKELLRAESVGAYVSKSIKPNHDRYWPIHD